MNFLIGINSFRDSRKGGKDHSSIPGSSLLHAMVGNDQFFNPGSGLLDQFFNSGKWFTACYGRKGSILQFWEVVYCRQW